MFQCVYISVYISLTHWGRVTHICVDNLTIIGSDNGLLPGRRQAIILINAGILLIRSGDYAQFPSQPPGSLVMWGTEWPNFNIVIQGKYFLWTMISNSLTENEEHGIPSQILKTIFGLHASVIF